MSCHHHPARHDKGHLGLEPAAAQPVFNPDPLSIPDVQPSGGIGMDLDHRVGIQSAQPRDVPVFGVEIDRRPPAGGQDQWVLLHQLRLGDRRERGFFVVRQWLQAPLLAERGEQFDFARWSLEAGFAVASQQPLLEPVVRRAGVALRGEGPALLLQLLECQAGRLDDIVKQVVDVFPLEVRVEPFRQLEVDLDVRPAVFDRDGFVDTLHGNPPGSDSVFFQEAARRQDDIGELCGGSVKQIYTDDEVQLLESF